MYTPLAVFSGCRHSIGLPFWYSWNLISGGFDLLVSLEGKSLKEVSTFVSDKLSTLESVLSTATHFVLKKYKDHGTILDKKHEDIRENGMA